MINEKHEKQLREKRILEKKLRAYRTGKPIIDSLIEFMKDMIMPLGWRDEGRNHVTLDYTKRKGYIKMTIKGKYETEIRWIEADE